MGGAQEDDYAGNRMESRQDMQPNKKQKQHEVGVNVFLDGKAKSKFGNYVKYDVLMTLCIADTLLSESESHCFGIATILLRQSGLPRMSARLVCLTTGLNIYFQVFPAYYLRKANGYSHTHLDSRR